LNPKYTVDEFDRALDAAGVLAAPTTRPSPAPGNLISGTRSAVFDGRRFPDLNAAAQANLSPFSALEPRRQSALLRAIAAHPGVRALADASRNEWFPLLLSFAHAAYLGVPDAREIALEWCRTSKRFKSEADFQRDWASFNPTRGITIGTLLSQAGAAGFDATPWFTPQPPATAIVGTATAGTFFTPVRFSTPDLHPVPWIVDNFAIAGDLTVIAGAGGTAKTALAVSMAVAIAAGRSTWGSQVIRPRRDGRPHRVAAFSGEEDGQRLGLLVAAAGAAAALTKAEEAAVARNLMMHDARQSGVRIGTPRPGKHEIISPDHDDQACVALENALKGDDISVLIVDTLSVALAADEIDNTAMTTLMRRVARIAKATGCATALLHHTPKMTREGAAALRGEVTLVRGGGAIVNVARVALTITGLPISEAGGFILSGQQPDAIRRLDIAKMNDAPRPDPLFFETFGVPVTLHDGSQEMVRAVRFLTAPQAATGAISQSALSVVVSVQDSISIALT
jgi:hypothetical protein